MQCQHHYTCSCLLFCKLSIFRGLIISNFFILPADPKTLSPDQWTHLVVTYDSSIEKAKIYIDGQRAAEGDGKGLLSQDWGARVGIGRHKDTRDLQGDVDEFSIYDVALPGEKILELTRKCDFEKYCK